MSQIDNKDLVHYNIRRPNAATVHFNAIARMNDTRNRDAQALTQYCIVATSLDSLSENNFELSPVQNFFWLKRDADDKHGVVFIVHVKENAQHCNLPRVGW